MFNRYTRQPTGRGIKVLRNDPSGVTTALTTLTGDDRLGWLVTAQLNAAYRCDAVSLTADAQRAGTTPANLRRRMLTAFDTAAATGTRPEPDGRWLAEQFGDALGAAVHGQPAPVTAAIRDEAATLYTGLDTVLVTATVTSCEYRGGEVVLIVNDWLADLAEHDDEEIAESVTEALAGRGVDGTSGGIRLADLYNDELLEELDGNTFEHRIELDVESLRAWLALHHPATLT
jgi:hypothetical protein